MARKKRKLALKFKQKAFDVMPVVGIGFVLAALFKNRGTGGTGGTGGSLINTAGAQPGGTPDTIDKQVNNTIMGSGEPARIVPVSPDAFIINGATQTQSNLAYAYYQEMLAEYISKAAAYQAAGKPPPAFSFQTGYWALVLPEITDARAYIYSTF